MGKSKIYTKKGDEGFTSLVGGKRVSKASSRIDAYGTIDELNSFIACLLEAINEREDQEFLLRIQSQLFTLGSYLASEPGVLKCLISEEEIAQIEAAIDRMDVLVPPLNRFILPGGCPGSAWANVCRTVCRRAERCMVKINKAGRVDTKALKYINRLSDYFFLLSRKQNFICNVEEIIWENPCK
ncbi:MAG: cob(I)yrinic acid a,c-diamide adenosyltransferase [Candidatus Azobacteroides sp.]|nr:cob(I)yrinic acid a,c-diamide adenosyltransferase [Candidatus Azobacteroides sp.]